jgi:cytidyltransferase-like protein
MGHEDIVRRAASLFSEVIVAVASNPGKKPFFDLNERVEMASHVLKDCPNVKVIGFSGLLMQFVQDQGARVVIRGLRAASDFESAVKRTPESEFRTKRCNQWVSSQSAWLPAGSWDALGAEIEITPDEEYVLGFDGSYASDSTALVVCTVPKEGEIPKVALVRSWEKNFGVDDDSWRVPMDEVKQSIIDYTQEYPKVREIACDPYRWAQMMQDLEELGLPIVEYKTNLLNLMIPATQKVFDAVVEGKLVHDGNPSMSRHIENCVIKTDHRGQRVTKEHANSKKKIDNAIAFIIAYDRATVGRMEEVVPQVFV